MGEAHVFPRFANDMLLFLQARLHGRNGMCRSRARRSRRERGPIEMRPMRKNWPGPSNACCRGISTSIWFPRGRKAGRDWRLGKSGNGGHRALAGVVLSSGCLPSMMQSAPSSGAPSRLDDGLTRRRPRGCVVPTPRRREGIGDAFAGATDDEECTFSSTPRRRAALPWR